MLFTFSFFHGPLPLVPGLASGYPTAEAQHLSWPVHDQMHVIYDVFNECLSVSSAQCFALFWRNMFSLVWCARRTLSPYGFHGLCYGGWGDGVVGNPATDNSSQLLGMFIMDNCRLSLWSSEKNKFSSFYLTCVLYSPGLDGAEAFTAVGEVARGKASLDWTTQSRSRWRRMFIGCNLFRKVVHAVLAVLAVLLFPWPAAVVEATVL